MKYTVNVGNIGNIDFTNKKKATETYNEYVNQSKTNCGRAAGESVYMMKGDNQEPIKEYIGTIDSEEETEPSQKTFTIEVSGISLSEVLNGIDEVRRIIESGSTTGFNSNDEGSFSFTTSGDFQNEED